MTLQSETASSINFRFTVARKINFATHQNSFAVIREMRLENLDKEEPLKDLTVVLNSDPQFLKPKQWCVDRIEPDGSIPIRDRDVKLIGQQLANLREAITGSLEFTVYQDGDAIAEKTFDVELLAPNEWGGTAFMPELLAAFCLPNDPVIDQILHDASRLLQQAGRPSQIDGYKSGSRERVWELASAIYAAVANLGLTYATPPASFETNGQKIRLPSQILKGKVATCLDSALLLAAAFEQAGLNAIICLLRDHALSGVWLQPEKLSSITNDEAEVIRKRFQLKELVLAESTFVTSHPAPPFSKAVNHAFGQLKADNDGEFVSAIDVARARAHKISPLGFRSNKDGLVKPHSDPADVQLPFEHAPSLPDFDQELEEQAPDTPAGRIERWLRKLLDLSARNPLLNHRSTKSSLTIFCPNPAALEDKLADGAKISVSPMPRSSGEEQDQEIHGQRTGESIDETYALDALRQNQVLVNISKDELDKRLVEIYRRAQTSLQEGGANTLYLAIGFLYWKRHEKDERRFKAPLILVPISMQRQSVRSGVKLLAHDDGPRFNTTLLEMLRKDFGIKISGLDGDLPEDESGADVVGIWNKVRRAIKDSPGFEVAEDVVLGHFSFAKYLMWKDLKDRAEALKENSVVSHLIESPRDPYASEIDFVQSNEIDESYEPKDFLTPLSADSSQMAAIASAARGKDFIVIGPPGTGKSQTISNLIAHLLGKGKTVLFVSEKTAALDVVYRRLAEIGLGRFCLELHSNKAKKTDVLNQLKVAWHSTFEKTEEQWKAEAESLRQLRDNLNDYVHKLHSKRRNGLSAHYALGVKVRDQDTADRMKFGWPNADQHSEAELAKIREAVDLLSIQAMSVGDFESSPFKAISRGDWSPDWQKQTVETAINLAKALREATAESAALKSSIGIEFATNNAAKLAALANLAMVLKKSHRQRVSFALESDGLDRIEALEKSIKHLRAYSDAQTKLSCPYDPMAWRDLDGVSLQARWEESERFWFLKKWLSRNAIRKEMRDGGAKGKPDPAIDAEVLTVLREEGEAIDALDKQLNSLRDWEGHDSDPEVIDRTQSLARDVRAATANLSAKPHDLIELRRDIQALLENGNDLLATDGPVGIAADRFLRSLSVLREATSAFEVQAGKQFEDLSDGSMTDLTSIRDLIEKIADKQAELNHWCGWQRRRNEALALDLVPLVEGIEDGRVPVSEIAETFEASYCTWFSEKILGEDEVLRSFSTIEHEDAIEKFRELDELFLTTTARYVEASLSDGIPGQGTVPQSSQWGVIKREITKRARHKPVRQLLEDAPDAVMKLAPCLMMSPLSVAQYLPADQSLFDVVIFDEASQITVWDAVGSIARGKQVIVAGDPKQMPPTNFFGRTDDDADGDIDFDGDLESILDELRSSNLPELTLNLHYRSRRESLIAFSNDRYYDNSLITFPAPESSDNGVRLVRPEGHYDRGKSRTNNGEAQAIVNEIVRRLTSNDATLREKTIGVVTFNSEQQTRIQDFLDIERSNRPDIEWAFSENSIEPVFVKNLETVQGDERDVILFSVTYGPDAAGNIYMNFGPLNRDGGERRMNVAMTRARSEMIVFSTLRPEEIDLTRTGARAVSDLKHFLEYAERGPDALIRQVHGSIGDFESPFESAVAAELRSKGWTVHPQIGVSAFRVDLGVVHPDHPGVYLAGVECDGAMYHSSAYARERDKIRQSVLEGLGWTLFRVWSTDWWINKAHATETLHQKLTEHFQQDRAERARELPSNDGLDDVPTTSSQTEQSEDGVSLRPGSHRSDDSVDRRVASSAGRSSVEKDGSASKPSLSNRDRRSPDEVSEAENQRSSIADKSADFAINTASAELGEKRPEQLVQYVVAVVEIEAPVHADTVVRRITQAAGLKRAGARIQDVVTSAINIAARRKLIRKKRDFLWNVNQSRATVRNRENLPQQDKKLDRIAPEEIAAAIIDVVKRNFSLSVDDALSESAAALGFQRVTANMRTRLMRILGALVTKDLLTRDGDLVSLKQ